MSQELTHLQSRIAVLEAQLLDLTNRFQGSLGQGRISDVTGDHIFTELQACEPGFQAAPACADSDEENPLLKILQPHCEYRFRVTAKVEWDTTDKCFYEHYGYLTIKDGRVVKVEFDNAGSDDCRQVIVCAVECGGGAY